MRNGIYQIDRFLPTRRHPLPHSPDWVSLSVLPYDFDPNRSITGNTTNRS